jgi:hypothetical protein
VIDLAANRAASLDPIVCLAPRSRNLGLSGFVRQKIASSKEAPCA